MFEKLLALLPYNPGLAHQMAFYSRRLREEAAIRRTGIVFLIMAFTIQFFAVLSPPQPTVASSSNDLINGGISSATDARRYCKNNTRHFADIMHHYGISCNTVGNAETVRISSNGHDGKLYSMGWNPQGQRNNKTNKRTNEQPVNVEGVNRPVYWRLLNSWDSGGSSSYTALKLRNSSGKTFWILYNCGNLVSVGIPPEERTPEPEEPTPEQPAPCQYNPALPANSPECFPHCPIPGKTHLPQNSPQCYNPCPYNESIPANSPQCFEPCKYDNSLPANSPKCFQPCEFNPNLPANSPDCKPCDKSAGSSDQLACVAVSKAASNITTGASDANGTTAHPNEVIEYKLFATNNGKADVKNFVFSENMSDVLDYADITDTHGGRLESDNQLSWPAETIAAGATVTHKVTVRVKAEIPQTPASSSDPAHFDLTMTNVYGNTINIKLPGSPTKTVEAVTTSTLPNTGPGTTLLIAGLTVILAGYCYARSELLAKESNLALKEMAAV